MSTMNATTARKELFKLLAEVNTTSEPVTIVNSNGNNAVLISEEDWKAIQESIYLNSIPGYAESIIKGGLEPIAECEEYCEDEEW